MDDIHFHVSGDVNINIVLPDSAGKAGDAASYHLCLDVSKLGTERTVEAICAYLEIAQRRKDEAAVD